MMESLHRGQNVVLVDAWCRERERKGSQPYQENPLWAVPPSLSLPSIFLFISPPTIFGNLSAVH